MKKTKISLRFAVDFVLICAFLAVGAEHSGTVIDQTTGKPIKDVLVSAGYSEYYTRTDANGRFNLSTPYSNTTSTVPALAASNNAPLKARWNFGGRTLDLRSAPGVSSASIYTLGGKMVFGGKVPLSRVLEVPSLTKGTYLIELRGEQGMRGRARAVVSNQSSASLVFNSVTLFGDNPRLSKSAQTNAATERLIFRHDNYYPKDVSPRADMSVSLEPDERSVVFDQSKVREYRFTISKEDSTYLDSYGWREEYVKANLTFENDLYRDVGLRYKGSDHSLPLCFDTVSHTKIYPKISYKVKFTEYDKEKRFYKMKKLCLHAMKSDPTKMHDMLAYELFREMGIPAPRTAYANVYVNNKLMGLFVAVEEPDGRFTKSRWPEYGDGNLYKEVWPKSAKTDYYVNGEERTGGGLKTNEDNPNVQRMVDYYNAIAASTEQNFAQKLSPFMDFDYFLRYLAAEVAIGHWDGARTWYNDETEQLSSNHNYYFYEEENAGGKIWIIPWDMDNTFWPWDYPQYLDPVYEKAGVPNWNVSTTNCSIAYDIFGAGMATAKAPNCDKFTKLTASVFGNRYAQLGNLFLNDQFQSQRLSAKIDKYSALIEKSVTEDPGFKNAEKWQYDNWKTKYVKELKESLPMRADKLKKNLEIQ